MGVRRKNEEDYAPTLLSVVLGALFGLSLGVMGAVFNLAVIPPVAVTEMPKDEDRQPRAVYFIRGSDAGGASWQVTRDQFVSGTGSLSVSESELNSWSRQRFRVDPPSQAPDLFTVELRPESPGFRVDGDRFEIAGNVGLVAFGTTASMQFQTRGRFEGTRFVPERTYLGSCPIPDVAGIPALMLGRLATSFASIEEFVQVENAWRRLTGVRVGDGRLQLDR